MSILAARLLEHGLDLLVAARLPPGGRMPPPEERQAGRLQVKGGPLGKADIEISTGPMPIEARVVPDTGRAVTLHEVSVVPDTQANRDAGAGHVVSGFEPVAAQQEEVVGKPQSTSPTGNQTIRHRDSGHGTVISTIPWPEGDIEVQSFGRVRPAPKPSAAKRPKR